ncbi:hypothetical protein GCM10009844_43320 [Nocardioides koreensis]|uniref:Uncharacterized protein n=1 Tax=Nocardioides koreensis TaxID=433651 RepID=A0ABP5LX87_9ACTN
MPSADDYTWLEDSLLGEAACLTVVLGKSRESVLADFGADAQVVVPIDDAYGNGVSLVDIPDGVIAIEYNGFQGAQPEVLRALSVDGSASSMFWNVNDDNAFSCARGGQLVATVDMYDAEDPGEVDLPDDLRLLFELGADEDADLHAIGLAMVEQFTGVKITAVHVENAEVAHPIENV